MSAQKLGNILNATPPNANAARRPMLLREMELITVHRNGVNHSFLTDGCNPHLFLYILNSDNPVTFLITEELITEELEDVFCLRMFEYSLCDTSMTASHQRKVNTKSFAFLRITYSKELRREELLGGDT